MRTEAEETDSSFGFSWGRVEGDHFLRNGDDEFKKVSSNVITGLREAATNGEQFSAVIDRIGEANPAAAETLRELSEEGYVRSGDGIERVRPPDDVRLWPRVALFVALLAVFVGASVHELTRGALAGLSADLSVGEYAAALVALLGFTAVHEYGHYRASKPYFDADVTVGTINAVVPTVKTVTNGAWLLPTNLRRWISLAGPLVELAACLPLVVARYAGVSDSPVLALVVVGVTSQVVFALNPLYHGDGYWLLVDTFGLDGLKSRGVEDLRSGRATGAAGYAVLSYGFALVATVGATAYAYGRFGPAGALASASIVGSAYLASWVGDGG
ncbi:hypothetical protein [Halorussus lipolyticus]|uniref:hypothetical protein n=1 Tax=Halorussus lipolyticus TaxID=3034024 RepID=UPI0023E884F2|nr:hypothetical protein [Halorussus sp. DT80]